ncbi:BamA/TamA family outer membrane protein [Mastigocoleus testarum]|uniref:POTRA domain-containing protein n=1 Tax=Mastigocoleus testarum BC008 TaxID=371196 RepID=A0A0V7ZDR2_9CYAN|nr:BamA/TamA family outer membrane protein [Mastigocoleus testarum]KST62551.1 hypothetical protein BC008_10295 [Mastigocoleus testarum BC008]KST62589.1 hypothetical protein BC008_10490 [Mastigocoleus testarum BC008]
MKNLYLLSISLFSAATLNYFSFTPAAKAQTTSRNNNSLSSTETKQKPEQDQVMVSEVVIEGVEEELKQKISKVIQVQAGQTITRDRLEQDINAIFAIGNFANVRVIPKDTPLGVKITFVVEPNPTLRRVTVKGSNVVPQKVIDKSFSQQYGKIINFREFQKGVKNLNQWYQDNGYVLAQTIAPPSFNSDGSVTLAVAEGIIEDIKIQFINEEGKEKDAEGKPIKGRTQKYVITREMQLKPGQVFKREVAQKDLQRIASLGIFNDLNLKFNPGKDPQKVVLVVNLREGKNISLTPTGGFSSRSGLFASGNFQAQNIGGRNQKFGTNVEVSRRDLTFDVNFSDPWIAGDPYRTSYKVGAFRKRSFSQIFDGGETDVELPNGDNPRVFRTGGNIIFRRPLSKNVFEKSDWVASAGLKYQKIAIRDSDGNLNAKDELGNDLSFSGDGEDDLFSIPLALVRDKRNNPLRPTKGSFLSLSSEQSIPIGDGNILSNKLRGNYSFYVPTHLTKFTKGCRNSKSNSKTDKCPQAFAFNLQAGTVLGDLPPYEAFSLGGLNSVRGFAEGDLGSARSFVQASAEYRFPVLSFLGGTVFFDAATDLGSSSSVVGNPGGARDKSGSGFGYGAGLRIQSPLGPVRLDYGFNNDGESRIQFGLGERF